MDELHSQALQAFEAARANDGLISPQEHKSLLKDFTLEDWKAVAKQNNDQNNLYGVLKNPVIHETPSEILIRNDEHRLRQVDITTGLAGLGYGAGAAAGGMAIGWAIGRYAMDSYRPAKWLGLAVGLLAGQKIYGGVTSEINDIKANANPLRIPKSSLRIE